MMQAQQAAMASLPMETQMKLRRASQANFAASLLQLSCSVAIIIMVRYNLESATLSLFTLGGQPAAGATYQCLMATDKWPGACQYAYSVASISILLNFLLSLMQCLTMDCCGMGRLLECLVDAGLIAWWMAAGITLGSSAAQANAQGAPKDGHRNAVVALCWVSMVLFAALLAINGYLTLKLGRAYVSAARQQQQYAQNGGPGGIQMASPVFPPGGPFYSADPNAAPPPAWGAPAYGYPAAAAPGGWPAPGVVAPPGGGPAPGQAPQPGAWPPAAGAGPYGGGPPITQAVVGGGAAPGYPPVSGAPGYPPVGGAGAGPGPSSGVSGPAAPGDKAAASSDANYLPPSSGR